MSHDLQTMREDETYSGSGWGVGVIDPCLYIKRISRRQGEEYHGVDPRVCP